jgi:4-amino-4-deoxy-L-arabinose transferase-like glycosyltransferase
MYVCAGLGVLAKGPVAAVLPALVFVAYLAVYGELSRIRTMMVPAGALIVLAIVAPWYVALYLDSGWTHIREFFVDENLGRFTQLIGPQSRGPWFYLPVVLTDMFPWSFVLPVAVAVWLRDRRSAPVEPGVRLRTLLLLWTLTIVCVFSFSTTKQDLYIFPIVAAVAALGGDVVARLAATGESPRRWLVVMTVAAGLLLVTVGALALYLFAHAETVYAIAGVRWAAGATIAGGAIAAVLARRRPLCAMLVVLAVLVAVDWTLVVRALPSFERYKPVVPFSEAILREARQGDRVVHYDVALPSMVFYLRRHVETLFAPEELLGVMQDSRDVLAVMPEHRYQELAGKFGRPTCVMLRRATFDAKLREMLSGREPPALLLVATRCPP